MSTIKSSAENLTLNADGANNDVIIQSNGSTKVHIDSTGKVGIGVTSIGTNDAVHIENGESYLVMKDAQQMGIKLYGDDTNVIFSYDKTANSITGGVTWAHADGTTIFYTGGTNARMTIDSTGAVTMPNQPAFSAEPSSDQNNIAVEDWVDVSMGTEIFDQNSDFASSLFTAPVTGKYALGFNLRLENSDTAANYLYVQIVTSNRNYRTIRSLKLASDPAYWNANLFVVADMDANDTAKVQVLQSGGTAQMDINASQSNFYGYLLG